MVKYQKVSKHCDHDCGIEAVQRPYSNEVIPEIPRYLKYRSSFCNVAGCMTLTSMNLAFTIDTFLENLRRILERVSILKLLKEENPFKRSGKLANY